MIKHQDDYDRLIKQRIESAKEFGDIQKQIDKDIRDLEKVSKDIIKEELEKVVEEYKKPRKV